MKLISPRYGYLRPGSVEWAAELQLESILEVHLEEDPEAAGDDEAMRVMFLTRASVQYLAKLTDSLHKNGSLLDDDVLELLPRFEVAE